MKSLKRALWLLGAAGIVVGLIVAVIILTSDFATQRGLLVGAVLLLGWSFIGTGLFAWSRRPDNNTGAIMVATGFSWFTLGLVSSNVPAVGVFGLLTNSVPIVMLVYLLLCFPDGHLHGRLERTLVGVAVLAGFVLQIFSTLFFDSANDADCDGCPANPLLVSHNSTLETVFNSAQNLLGVALFVVLIVVLLRRRRTYSAAKQAAVAPVFWTGGAAIGLFMGVVLMNIVGLDGLSDIFFLGTVVAAAAIPFGFLFGLMRGRFTRAAAVSDLVERLGRAPTGEQELHQALARALGDASLEVAYWLPDGERYVDSVGRPAELPREGSGRSVSKVDRDGRRVAAIIHDDALLDAPDLIRTVGAAAALSLENERLEAELRARIEELRSSRTRIVEAGNTARRKLERDLHDGAQQHLVALSLDLKLARSKVASDPEGADELLGQAVKQLDEATGELRELARGIHPAVLTDRGLQEALKALATRASLPVELDCEPQERLPDAVESTAYFLVSEALTNVSRYAEATHAEIKVERNNGCVVIEVRDDGVGGANPAAGSGLSGLEDRVAALDGTMEVVSPAGNGTVVRASLPCA